MAKIACERRSLEVENHLEAIYSFLQSHLALANVNTVGFFTENQWSLIPNNIQKELLSMSDEDLCQLAIKEVCVPQSDRCDRQKCDTQTAVVVVDNEVRHQTNDQPKFSSSSTTTFSSDAEMNKTGPIDLNTFISEAQRHCLRHSPLKQLISDIEDVVYRSVSIVTENNCPVDFGMKTKKFHEVVLMSDTINQLSISYEIKQVIDIGSGKGYLSQHLSLHQGLNVLGIDASETNTAGALERNRKLQKFWPGLVKRRESSRNEGVCQSGEVMPVVAGDEVCTDSGERNSDQTTSEPTPVLAVARKEKTSHSSATDGSCKEAVKSFKPVTAFVDTSTELSRLCVEDPDDDADDGGDDDDKDIYTHKDAEPFLLTGLHTCGDLAPSILRLFTSNQSAKVLCNVGCCYNLLTEKFDSQVSDIECEFPMSGALRRREAKIGRGGRMLACSSVERSASEERLPSKSLYYRAVLQVIIEDHYQQLNSDQRVGKVAAKSKTFLEYVRKALKKLKLDETKLSDEEINKYDEKYSKRERSLQCFVQFRSVLAPVIEDLILLDRLCYLLEQEDVESAHLVQIFDPVISPRCHAIIGIRR